MNCSFGFPLSLGGEWVDSGVWQVFDVVTELVTARRALLWTLESVAFRFGILIVAHFYVTLLERLFQLLLFHIFLQIFQRIINIHSASSLNFSLLFPLVLTVILEVSARLWLIITWLPIELFHLTVAIRPCIRLG